MLTYPKSILGVLRMLIHLTLGHVTLPSGEFHPYEFSPQSDLGCWVDSRWALPQISSFFVVLHLLNHDVIFSLNIYCLLWWLSIAGYKSDNIYVCHVATQCDSGRFVI